MSFKRLLIGLVASMGGALLGIAAEAESSAPLWDSEMTTVKVGESTVFDLGGLTNTIRRLESNAKDVTLRNGVLRVAGTSTDESSVQTKVGSGLLTFENMTIINLNSSATDYHQHCINPYASNAEIRFTGDCALSGMLLRDSKANCTFSFYEGETISDQGFDFGDSGIVVNLVVSNAGFHAVSYRKHTNQTENNTNRFSVVLGPRNVAGLIPFRFDEKFNFGMRTMLTIDARSVGAGTYPIMQANPLLGGASLAQEATVLYDESTFSLSRNFENGLVSITLTVKTPDPIVETDRVVINEVQASNDKTITDDLGEECDWVELYNGTTNEVDLSGWGLSDKAKNPFKWTFPEGTIIAPHTYLMVFCDEEADPAASQQLHAALSLSASGETLILTSTNKVSGATAQVDEVTYARLPCDTSFGRVASNWTELGYFNKPTPGRVNVAAVYAAPLNPVVFSAPRGLYQDEIYLALSNSDPDAIIYYTLDHSEPSADKGIRYTGAFPISQTTIVRATAVKAGTLPYYNVTTATYLYLDQVPEQKKPAIASNTWKDEGECPASYGVSTSVVYDAETRAKLTASLRAAPIVSLTTTDYDMFDPEMGIHSKPSSFRDTSFAERLASVEWLGGGVSNLVFGLNAGVRMQGNYARKFDSTPKKGFRLIFRSRYGENRLEEPVLVDGGYNRASFKSLVLRPEHNESWGSGSVKGTSMKDQFFRDLQFSTSGFNLGGSHIQLFVNGLYWGLYNITEHGDENAAEDRFGGRSDDYGVFKKRVTDTNPANPFAFTNYMAKLVSVFREVGRKEGLIDANNSVVKDKAHLVVASPLWKGTEVDMTLPAHYDEAARFVDLDAFIDYMILGYYSGNTDWPYNNWIAAGSAETGIPFRFFVWDFELGYISEKDNTADDFQAKYEMSPQYLQKALERSPAYRRRFGDRIAKLMRDDGVLSVDSLTNRYLKLAQRVEPMIFGEVARWGAYRYDIHKATNVLTEATWRAERDRIVESVIPKRANIFIEQMRAIGLYPITATPVGHVELTDEGGLVTVEPRPQVTYYYTTDGADPCEADTDEPALAARPVTGEISVATATTVKVRGRHNETGEWSVLWSRKIDVPENWGEKKVYARTDNGENFDKKGNWNPEGYPNDVGAWAEIGVPTETKSDKLWRNIHINKNNVTLGHLDFYCGGWTNRIDTDEKNAGGNLIFKAPENERATWRVLDESGKGLSRIKLDERHCVKLDSSLELVVPENVGSVDFGGILIEGCLEGPGGLIKRGGGLATIAATNATTSLGAVKINEGTLAFTKGEMTVASVEGSGTLVVQMSATNETAALRKTLRVEESVAISHLRIYANTKDAPIVYGACVAKALPAVSKCEVFVVDEAGLFHFDEKRYRAVARPYLEIVAAEEGYVCYKLDLTKEAEPVSETETESTPVPVPFSWFEHYMDVSGFQPADYERAALEKGKNGRPLWESYVAGLDPDDPTDDFHLEIQIDANGVPHITYTTGHGASKALPRHYQLKGANDFGKWIPINPEDAPNYHFFKMDVELTGDK